MAQAEAIKLIEKARTVLLVGHTKPDGDSIGCQLALWEALTQLGKEVSLCAFDPVPRVYQFLNGSDMFELCEIIDKTYDLAILVEVPRLSRSGFTAIPAEATIGIDHHPDYELNADTEIVNTKVAAAAELVYPLLLGLEVDITTSIAESLLTAIVTDCGFFSYNLTTPETLETGAELMRAGADIAKIAEAVNRNHPQARLTLQTELLKGMKYLADGACALLIADSKMIEKGGYADELFEGMVNIPLEVDSIHASILARQNPNGSWRFSLRGKGTYDVGSVARSFGGGGHRNAAGFRADEALAKVVSKLDKRISDILA